MTKLNVTSLFNYWRSHKVKTIFSDLSCFQFCAKFLIFRRNFLVINTHIQSSRPEVFLRKGVLKIHSKFTGERPCQSAISVKLQSNFIEITLRYGCSPVHLLYIFRAHFSRNTSWWLLLTIKHLKMFYWISLDFMWLLVSWQLLGVWMKELNWSHLLFLFSFCSGSVILSNTTIDVHRRLVKYLH